MVDAIGGDLPRNSALGATCEDQERYLLNATHLRYAKSALGPVFTFISAEPLLGPLELYLQPSDCLDPEWIITGGETDQGGHKARPSNPQWFRDIRDQCVQAQVAYHHKQNGEWVSVSEVEGDGAHFSFDDGRTVRRIGKRRSGRTIDGAVHDARPEITMGAPA
jgi:protein gp37